MFCKNCGSKLNDGANFCSNCGARVEEPAVQVQEPVPQFEEPFSAVSNSSYGLPEGMTMTPDGKIWWSYTEKKDRCLCCVDEQEIVFMRENMPKKKSALGSFAIDMINLAAIDANPFADEPFPEGEENPDNFVFIDGIRYSRSSRTLNFIKIIKEDRKNNIIKLHDTYWWKLPFTPEQYDFALNYFITHCPKAKRK